VYTEAELRAMAERCAAFDMTIFSDEIHADLTLDQEQPHIPVASLSDDIAQRTITMMSSSKTFNLAADACSFAIIPNEQLREQFQRSLIHGSQPSASAFAAAQAAFTEGHLWHNELKLYLKKNRDLVESFGEQSSMRVHPVQGTYMAWLDASATGIPTIHQHLLDNGVQLDDGGPYLNQSDGLGYLRLNFALPREQLVIGLNRMTAALNQLSAA